jgi:hypothetical protein
VREASILIVALACGGSQPLPCVVGRPAPTPLLAVPGQPVDVELALPLACDDRVKISLGRVTVLDPSGTEIAPDTAPTFTRTPAVVRTNFTFTPPLSGRFEATASFDPDIGVVTRDVQVGVDHSAEPPAFAMDPASAPASCGHLDITPRSRLLCIGAGGPMTLYEADGRVLQTLDAQYAALRGNALWTDDAQGQLARWVESELEDGGDGFVRSPDTSVTFKANAWLFPTADGVIAFTRNGTAVSVHVEDGGLTSAPAGPLGPTVGIMPTWDAAWSDGSLLIGETAESTTAVVFGHVGSGTLTYPGSTIAMDRFGLWHRDPTVNSPPYENNALWLINSGGPAQVLPIPGLHAYGTATLPFLWETGVALESDTLRFVASFNGTGLDVEAYPPTDAGIASITGTSVTLRTPGSVQLYRRTLTAP